MTDRDRLIELCENVILSCKASLCDDCEHNKIDYPHCMGVHFADYLLANGVIVPPCKVGDTVYTNINGTGLHNSFRVETVDLLGFSNGLYHWTWHQLGKSVFLSIEEAEAKMKGGAE